VVEINSPLIGIDRRVGAVFAKDAAGKVALIHRGRIGGGREKVGKSGLLELVDSAHLVRFEDGDRESEGILIGRIDALTSSRD